MWEPLFNEGMIHIDFAHRTFQWDSEASIKAHVHCIIIGFSQAPSKKQKQIFDNGRVIIAENINPYLVNGDTVFVEGRKVPISANAPTMYIGCEMKDDGFYTLSEEEKN